MQFTPMQEWKTIAAPLLLAAVLAGTAPASAQDAPPPQNATSPRDALQQQVDPPQQDAGPDLKSLSLEELMEIEVQTVVSASKYRQKVSEAPASISIITDDDIRKYGYRTLADILRSVRGLYTTYDRNYQYLGIRGFGRPGDYNTRILLLVDGHRMNDAAYASAAIGTDFVLDVDLIERVEVTRGPGSSLYGSNAFFGVVNVITRRGIDKGSVELSGEAASGKAFKGRLTYDTGAGREQRALLSATRYTSDGERLYFPEYDPGAPLLADPRAANGGYADGGDGDRFQSGFARYTTGGFTLSGAIVERTKIIPTASYGTDFNDSGNRTTDRQAYIDANYAIAGRGGAEYTLRGYYDWYRYDGAYVYGGIVNQDRAYGDGYGGEARVTARVLSSHRVIAGAEFEARTRQDQWNGDADAAGTVYLDDRRTSQTWAVYAQDEITVSPIFVLYAGVRHDQASMFGGSTNPRLAAVLRPIENGTLKLLYGTAFRAPTVYEMWYQAPPDIGSNPALQPEKITTYELVYEHDFGQGLRAMVGRYSYGIEDLITQSTEAGITSFQNLDRAEAVGTELEVQKNWQNGISGRMSYANQKAVNPTTGGLLTNAPEHLAKLNVAVPLAGDRLVLGLEEQYTGARYTEARLRADAFFLTNVTLLARNVQKTVEASLSFYNLLDEHYADPVSIDLVPLDTVQQDGRTIRFKLTYAF